MNTLLDRRVYFILGVITGFTLARLLIRRPVEDLETMMDGIDMWIAEQKLSKKR